MKKVHKAINKNIRMLLIVAAVTVVALAALLMLIAGNEERNQIPTDPTRVSETDESEEPTDVNETTVPTEEGVSQEAQNLYNARLETIDDPAGVAKLLETIDLKAKVANYKVELLVKEEPFSMIITFETTISGGNQDAFDKRMEIYAEQILALVSDAQQVQWVYDVKGENKEKEQRTVFLDEAGAKELLGSDVKRYGESAKMIQSMLDRQNRKDLR